MDYDEYVRIQTEVHGQIKKPRKYRVGQRKAIDWFFKGVNKNSEILDVGCGVGDGIKHLHSLGFNRVSGVELHPKKVEFCRKRDLVVFHTDILTWQFWRKYSVFWVSHSFEHMWQPVGVIQKLKKISNPNALFFFVMPYPDTGDQSAHCASKEIGLRNDDDGKSVINWFAQQGLYMLDRNFDDFREPEIWLALHS